MSHPTISQRKTSMGHQHLTRSQRDINKSISSHKISKEKRHQWINESSQNILGETSMSHPHLTKSKSSMTSMSHLTQYQMETLMSHQHLIRSRERYQWVITISQYLRKRHHWVITISHDLREIPTSHHHFTRTQKETSVSHHHLTRYQMEDIEVNVADSAAW